MIKKLGLSFLLAAILILSFHKTLASNLNVLPPLLTDEKTVQTITCVNLEAVVRGFERDLTRTNQILSKYQKAVSKQYRAWHQSLVLLEGRSAQLSDEDMSIFNMSVQNLSDASDSVYSISGHDDDFVVALQSAIVSCYKSSEKRDEAILHLQTFLTDDSEHLSIVADFLSQMYYRLQSFVQEWEIQRMSPDILPPAYFAPVLKESEIFAEAANLSAENAEYIKNRFSDFKASLGQCLLPLAQP